MSKLLGLLEVGKVKMVRPNLYWFRMTFQVVSIFL